MCLFLFSIAVVILAVIFMPEMWPFFLFTAFVLIFAAIFISKDSNEKTYKPRKRSGRYDGDCRPDCIRKAQDGHKNRW